MAKDRLVSCCFVFVYVSAGRWFIEQETVGYDGEDGEKQNFHGFRGKLIFIRTIFVSICVALPILILIIILIVIIIINYETMIIIIFQTNIILDH